MNPWLLGPGLAALVLTVLHVGNTIRLAAQERDVQERRETDDIIKWFHDIKLMEPDPCFTADPGRA